MAYPSPRAPLLIDADLKPYRGWMITVGVALTIIGALAIAGAVLTTMLTMKVLGWMLVIGGAIQIVHAFSAPRWRGVILSLLEGVLYAVVGVLMVTRPLESAAVVTLLLSAFLMTTGFFRILAVPTFLRIRNWGWVLASGIISFLLGIAIWAQWPVSGLWVLDAFIGIEMIGWGISLIMLGVSVGDVDVAAPRHLEAA